MEGRGGGAGGGKGREEDGGRSKLPSSSNVYARRRPLSGLSY